jgi:hypothetical protein
MYTNKTKSASQHNNNYKDSFNKITKNQQKHTVNRSPNNLKVKDKKQIVNSGI